MNGFDEKIERQQRRSERNKQKRRYESSHEERTMEPETRKGIVADAILLNFRSAPNRKDESNIVDVLKKGTRFEILSEVDDMIEVRLEDGRVGYVASQFCQEV